MLLAPILLSKHGGAAGELQGRNGWTTADTLPSWKRQPPNDLSPRPHNNSGRGREIWPSIVIFCRRFLLPMRQASNAIYDYACQTAGKPYAWLCPCRNAATPLLAMPLLILMLSALELGLMATRSGAESDTAAATATVAELEPEPVDPRSRGINALGLPSSMEAIAAALAPLPWPDPAAPAAVAIPPSPRFRPEAAAKALEEDDGTRDALLPPLLPIRSPRSPAAPLAASMVGRGDDAASSNKPGLPLLMMLPPALAPLLPIESSPRLESPPLPPMRNAAAPLPLPLLPLLPPVRPSSTSSSLSSTLPAAAADAATASLKETSE